MPKIDKVIVLDDDLSIHGIWDERFGSVLPGFTLQHLSTPDDFIKEMEVRYSTDSVLCLVDYELLGFTVNGLDLIEKFKLQDVAYLVTSRFEERDVIARCIASGVRMLPKPAAAYVPIWVKDDSPTDNSGDKAPDAVLIDDDDLVHDMWLQAALTAGKVLHVYYDPRAFFNALAKYRLSVPIYVDSELASGAQGEHIAQDLTERGFESVFLATGHSASRFKHMPWLSGVIGKEPPF